jgi:hypothetical protein
MSGFHGPVNASNRRRAKAGMPLLAPHHHGPPGDWRKSPPGNMAKPLTLKSLENLKPAPISPATVPRLTSLSFIVCITLICRTIFFKKPATFWNHALEIINRGLAVIPTKDKTAIIPGPEENLGRG